MRNMKVKVIADTSVGAALVVLFILIASYVPFIAAIGAFVSGIPLAYLSCKNGTASGVFATVVAFGVSFALTGNLISLGVVFLSYTIPGLAFGIAIYKNASFYTAVAITAAVALLGVILDITLITGGVDGIGKMLDTYMSDVQNTLKEVYTAGGIPESAELTTALSKAADIVKRGITLYMPTILILIGFIYGYIICLAASYILKRLKVKSIEKTPFNKLRAPRIVCNMTIILFIISFFMSNKGVTSAAIKNVLLISEIILGVCGIAFVDYKFSKSIKVGFLRVIIYLGICFTFTMLVPIIADIMVLIGFFTRRRHPID